MAPTETIEAIRDCVLKIGNTQLRDELLAKVDRLHGELKARQAPSSGHRPRFDDLPESIYDPPI